MDNSLETIRQEPIVGFLDNDRMFYVNLMRDATFTFTWLNGEKLTEIDKKKYCTQITNAQNKLETVQTYILRGRGMSQFGFWNWPYSQTVAGAKTKSVKYYSAGKVDKSIESINCKIKTKADLEL
jgi:hypothetical protein